MTFFAFVLMGMYITSGVIGVGYGMRSDSQPYGIYWWDLDFANPFHWLPVINVGSGFLFMGTIIIIGLT